MARLIDKTDGFLPRDMNGYGLYIEAGIIEEFDLDNTLKGVIDALQAAYEFNDNQIKGLICRKVVVGNYPLSKAKWNKQYIKIGLLEYTDPNCEIINPDDISGMEEDEKKIKVSEHLQMLLYRAVASDVTDFNSKSERKGYYPINLQPDLENAERKSRKSITKLKKALAQALKVFNSAESDSNSNAWRRYEQELKNLGLNDDIIYALKNPITSTSENKKFSKRSRTFNL